MSDLEADGFVGDYPLWTCVSPHAPQIPVCLGQLNDQGPFVGLFTDEDLLDRFLVPLHLESIARKLKIGSAQELLRLLAEALLAGSTHVVFDPSARGGGARYTGMIGKIVERIGKDLQPKIERGARR